MAGKVRNGKKGEAKLLVALAGGATITAAAKSAGIAERTAYRYLASPGFRRKVLEIRIAMIDRATGRLARASSKAADTLRELLGSTDEKVKGAAADKILRLGTALRDSTELNERISKLEEAVLDRRK